jgi:hypothetical protein
VLTDRQIKKQMFWTNGCYRAALLEHYDFYLSKKQKRFNIQELKEQLTKVDKPVNSPEINALYMKRVLALDPKKLSIIVEAFHNGRQFRKQETIDAIMTELFERSAKPETRGTYESQI